RKWTFGNCGTPRKCCTSNSRISRRPISGGKKRKHPRRIIDQRLIVNLWFDSLGQQLDQDLFVDLGQRVQILSLHTLVHFVNGGVDRAEFDHLGTGGRNEATV